MHATTRFKLRRFAESCVLRKEPGAEMHVTPRFSAWRSFDCSWRLFSSKIIRVVNPHWRVLKVGRAFVHSSVPCRVPVCGPQASRGHVILIPFIFRSLWKRIPSFWDNDAYFSQVQVFLSLFKKCSRKGVQKPNKFSNKRPVFWNLVRNRNVQSFIPIFNKLHMICPILTPDSKRLVEVDFFLVKKLIIFGAFSLDDRNIS